MEWIHRSEEECSWLWVKMPGVNSVFCGSGPQCLRKYNKQQKVLPVSSCLVSQQQNGNYKTTQNSQQSCEGSRLMPIMFLVTSKKCLNNKKPQPVTEWNNSPVETAMWGQALQPQSQSIQEWSLGGSPAQAQHGCAPAGWAPPAPSCCCPLPGWAGSILGTQQQCLVPDPPCQTFPRPDSGCGPNLRATLSCTRLLNLEAALYFSECKWPLSTTKPSLLLKANALKRVRSLYAKCSEDEKHEGIILADTGILNATLFFPTSCWSC